MLPEQPACPIQPILESLRGSRRQHQCPVDSSTPTRPRGPSGPARTLCSKPGRIPCRDPGQSDTDRSQFCFASCARLPDRRRAWIFPAQFSRWHTKVSNCLVLPPAGYGAYPGGGTALRLSREADLSERESKAKPNSEERRPDLSQTSLSRVPAMNPPFASRFGKADTM